MQKTFVYFFYQLGTNPKYRYAVAALLLLGLVLAGYTLYSDSDSHPGRGAGTVSADVFGDSFTEVKYLEQNWSPADSLWFYNTTQGSDLLPYDFFLFLEQPKSSEPFRSPANMNRYRYLPQIATASNPDALPAGMVADTYRGTKYMGFTCAACHTSQLNYKGVGIRIDGGPGAADMDGFMKDMAAALAATRDDSAKGERFVTAVLKAGNYADGAAVLRDLNIYALRIEAYNFFNESTVSYGYARLDAFGRIYNRVLEHVLDPVSLKEVLAGSPLSPGTAQLLDKFKSVLSAADRDRLMALLVKLPLKERRTLREKVFNPPNAPVSYPFLWDIPQHDFVQWNGIGANAGVGPIGRNAGEVLGVFGTLDWERKPGWTISSVIGGQGFGKEHISFRSSVDVHNLRRLEERLANLQSPRWIDAVKVAKLPELDEARMKEGEKVFDLRCAKCHAEIDRASPTRRIVAQMANFRESRTDPKMADNSVKYEGYSGILRNLYSTTEVGDILLDNRAPVAAILTTATENVVATPDPDQWFFWLYDLVKEYFRNKIKPSIRSGKYTPSTTAKPFESLRAYKARSLNGIWATAPYLHNGSVPTLYDLLLPAKPEKGDPPDTRYRPKTFMVGSREFDPIKVGFKHGETEYQGFLFDTRILSNNNEGHEYGTRTMSKEDRLNLVEYLKQL